jgi:hypothetical protein
MFSIKRAPNGVSRQRGSADTDLIMKGGLALLGAGTFVAVLVAAGVLSALSGPELTLTQKLAAERLEPDRQEERTVLLQQLNSESADISCSPAPAGHALTCQRVVYGLLKKTHRFDVALAPTLPVVGFSFYSRSEKEFTLTFNGNLPHEQRLAILRAITPAAATPASASTIKGPK